MPCEPLAACWANDSSAVSFDLIVERLVLALSGADRPLRGPFATVSFWPDWNGRCARQSACAVPPDTQFGIRLNQGWAVSNW